MTSVALKLEGMEGNADVECSSIQIARGHWDRLGYVPQSSYRSKVRPFHDRRRLSIKCKTG